MNLVKQLRTWDEMPEDDSDAFEGATPLYRAWEPKT